MSRRLRAAILAALVLSLATAAPAFADYTVCTSTYVNGCLTSRFCNHYYDDGTWKGSVSEEYQC